MVPSICPLETLHNALSLKQVDEFLASIASPSSETPQKTPETCRKIIIIINIISIISISISFGGSRYYLNIKRIIKIQTQVLNIILGDKGV